jgi:anti-anti-sigma factor
MEVRTTTEKNAGILHVSGQFGYGDEKRLADLGKTLASQGAEVIAIDATGLDYINSLGVAALLALMKVTDEHNCEYVVYGMKKSVELIVQKVFENEYVPMLSAEEFRRRFLE